MGSNRWMSNLLTTNKHVEIHYWICFDCYKMIKINSFSDCFHGKTRHNRSSWSIRYSSKRYPKLKWVYHSECKLCMLCCAFEYSSPVTLAPWLLFSPMLKFPSGSTPKKSSHFFPSSNGYLSKQITSLSIFRVHRKRWVKESSLRNVSHNRTIVGRSSRSS